MNWTLKEANLGDMVRVKSGSIYHYGVFVSEDEIIQFGLAPALRPSVKPCDVEVCSSDVDGFLGGGFLEVAVLDRKETKKRRPVKETVAMARERLGEKGYHILYNNCEHFAYECVMGERYCSQTDLVRSLFKSLPVLDLYTLYLPSELPIGSIGVKDIDEEIAAISDEKQRLVRYLEWKLFEYGAERSLGLKLSKLKLSRDKNGAWSAEPCKLAFLSSEDEGFVAVAVSRAAVALSLGNSEGDGKSVSATLSNSSIVTVLSDTPDKLRIYDNIKLK